MPYNAIKVGNELLRLAAITEPPRFVTPLQLMKLVYVAHGWSLHFSPSNPLLSEQAQAWQYGPVIPTLYHAVKQFGSAPITGAIAGDTDPQILASGDIELIAAVYAAYGHLSGTQLSSMTHQPNTPWSNAWNEHGRNAMIPNAEIHAHYNMLAETRKHA